MQMPGGGHEQEEEVEVSVGEEAALVDLVEETLGGAGDHVLRGHPVSVQVILSNLHTENIFQKYLVYHLLTCMYEPLPRPKAWPMELPGVIAL